MKPPRLSAGMIGQQRGIEPVLFLGKSAANADHEALARAVQMQEGGTSRDEIWTKTGWGYDDRVKQWFFETDDRHFKPGPIRGTKPLHEALPHDDLLAAYDTSNVVVEPSPRNERTPFGPLLGQYVGSEFRRDGEKDRIRLREGMAGAGRRVTGLHELQHFADDADGLSYRQHGGGEYLAHPLERRAYNVEFRRDLSPERRRELPPWQTEAELSEIWKPMAGLAAASGEKRMINPRGLAAAVREGRGVQMAAAPPQGLPQGRSPVAGAQHDPTEAFFYKFVDQLGLDPREPMESLFQRMEEQMPTDHVLETIDYMRQKHGIKHSPNGQRQPATPPGPGLDEYISGRSGEPHIGALQERMDSQHHPNALGAYQAGDEALINVLRRRNELKGGR